MDLTFHQKTELIKKVIQLKEYEILLTNDFNLNQGTGFDILSSIL